MDVVDTPVNSHSPRIRPWGYRKEATLLNQSENFVVPRSVVVTDEWAGYNVLGGYIH